MATEVEEAPVEEPDTPIEELRDEGGNVKPEFDELVALAKGIASERAARKEHERREEELAKKLLPLMRAHENLHGIRLEDGTAVRRRWNSNRPTIDPVKLGTRVADANDYIRISVDQAKLRADYPVVWREFGGKVTEGVVVYEPRKPKGGA